MEIYFEKAIELLVLDLFIRKFTVEEIYYYLKGKEISDTQVPYPIEKIQHLNKIFHDHPLMALCNNDYIKIRQLIANQAHLCRGCNQMCVIYNDAPNYVTPCNYPHEQPGIVISCRYCAKTIPQDAILCPYCGANLTVQYELIISDTPLPVTPPPPLPLPAAPKHTFDEVWPEADLIRSIKEYIRGHDIMNYPAFELMVQIGLNQHGVPHTTGEIRARWMHCREKISENRHYVINSSYDCIARIKSLQKDDLLIDDLLEDDEEDEEETEDERGSIPKWPDLYGTIHNDEEEIEDEEESIPEKTKPAKRSYNPSIVKEAFMAVKEYMWAGNRRMTKKIFHKLVMSGKVDLKGHTEASIWDRLMKMARRDARITIHNQKNNRIAMWFKMSSLDPSDELVQQIKNRIRSNGTMTIAMFKDLITLDEVYRRRSLPKLWRKICERLQNDYEIILVNQYSPSTWEIQSRKEGPRKMPEDMDSMTG